MEEAACNSVEGEYAALRHRCVRRPRALPAVLLRKPSSVSTQLALLRGALSRWGLCRPKHNRQTHSNTPIKRERAIVSGATTAALFLGLCRPSRSGGLEQMRRKQRLKSLRGQSVLCTRRWTLSQRTRRVAFIWRRRWRATKHVRAPFGSRSAAQVSPRD